MRYISLIKCFVFISLFEFIMSSDTVNLKLLNSNVLLPAWYISFVNRNGYIVNSADRVKKFRSLMERARGEGVDVLTFQEWPIGDAQVYNGQEDVIIANSNAHAQSISKQEAFSSQAEYFREGLNRAITEIFPEEKYAHFADPYKKGEDGLYTVVNKDKFSIAASLFRAVIKNKSVYEGETIHAIKLIYKDNPLTSVSIVSGHLPWVTNGGEPDPTNLRLMKDTLDDKLFDAQAKIATGDLNYNVFNNETQAFFDRRVEILKQVFPGYSLSAEDMKAPTATGPSVEPKLLIDHVIYSGVQKTGHYLMPAEVERGDLSALINHEACEAPQQNKFYSDHAAIRYDFQINASASRL